MRWKCDHALNYHTVLHKYVQLLCQLTMLTMSLALDNRNTKAGLTMEVLMRNRRLKAKSVMVTSFDTEPLKIFSRIRTQS